MLFSCASTYNVDKLLIEKALPLNRTTILTAPENKIIEIKNYNNASFFPQIPIQDNYSGEVLVAGLGESIFLSLLISNDNMNNLDYSLSIDDDRIIQFKAFRVLPVSNWYLEGNLNRSEMEYVPDALFALPEVTSRKFNFNIKPKECIQLFVELSSYSSFTGNISLKLVELNTKLTNIVQYPVKFLDYDLKSLETFPSIIFNYVNLSSNEAPVKSWLQTGLTDLQINYIPTMYFDNYGNPTSNIELGTSSSTGFRNTAYPWIEKGGRVTLFWDSRYDKVAPIRGGGYLKPFTAPWKRAYKHLLNKLYKELQIKFPKIQDDQLRIYLADELSSFNRSDKSYTTDELIDFSKFLEFEFPQFKTMVTYGYLSDASSVNMLEGIDIKIPHVNLPFKKNFESKIINPQSVYLSLKNKKIEKWFYSVERGKTSDLYRFRFFPMLSVVMGYESYSWYAFADHSGSTWLAADGNRLDYSLYYHAEPKNKVYNYWKSRIGTSDYMTSSLRMKAIERGLVNARLLKTIIRNKENLDLDGLIHLQGIIEILKKYNLESVNPLNLSQEDENKCKEIEISLRFLYAQIQQQISK